MREIHQTALAVYRFKFDNANVRQEVVAFHELFSYTLGNGWHPGMLSW